MRRFVLHDVILVVVLLAAAYWGSTAQASDLRDYYVDHNGKLSHVWDDPDNFQGHVEFWMVRVYDSNGKYWGDVTGKTAVQAMASFRKEQAGELKWLHFVGAPASSRQFAKGMGPIAVVNRDSPAAKGTLRELVIRVLNATRDRFVRTKERLTILLHVLEQAKKGSFEWVAKKSGSQVAAYTGLLERAYQHLDAARKALASNKLNDALDSIHRATADLDTVNTGIAGVFGEINEAKARQARQPERVAPQRDWTSVTLTLHDARGYEVAYQQRVSLSGSILHIEMRHDYREDSAVRIEISDVSLNRLDPEKLRLDGRSIMLVGKDMEDIKQSVTDTSWGTSEEKQWGTPSLFLGFPDEAMARDAFNELARLIRAAQ